MTYRAIPDIKMEREFAPPKGTMPAGIVWLPLEDLAVDARYQRELGDKGVQRVRAIAINFDWRKFTPIVVAKRSDRGYAVIDGQHRAAAVRARGDIPKVPAWVIDTDVAGQAEAFLSINAESARVPTGAMWYARAAAGEPRAEALFAACEKAKVRILKWPMDASRRRYDHTLAPAEISSAISSHGEQIVVNAMIVLRNAGELAGRCLLSKGCIRAAVLLTRHDKQWRSPHIHVALADIEPREIEARAAIASRNEGGSAAEHIVRLIREHVTKKIAAVTA